MSSSLFFRAPPVGERLALLRGPALFAGACGLLGAYATGVGLATGASPCPFYALTGMPCPGCGGTRALMALGQGEVLTALSYNGFGLVVFFAAALLWIRWTYRRARGQAVPIASFSRTFAWAFFAATALWTVLRWTPLYPGIPL